MLAIACIATLVSRGASGYRVGQLGRGAAIRSSSRALRMGLFDAFRPSAAPSDPAVYAAVRDAAPSWDELRVLSAKAGGERFRAEWDAQAVGRGAANHQSSIRLFDAPEGTEPRVELFRDTAAVSAASRRARASVAPGTCARGARART